MQNGREVSGLNARVIFPTENRKTQRIKSCHSTQLNLDSQESCSTKDESLACSLESLLSKLGSRNAEKSSYTQMFFCICKLSQKVVREEKALCCSNGGAWQARCETRLVANDISRSVLESDKREIFINQNSNLPCDEVWV